MFVQQTFIETCWAYFFQKAYFKKKEQNSECTYTIEKNHLYDAFSDTPVQRGSEKIKYLSYPGPGASADSSLLRGKA